MSTGIKAHEKKVKYTMGFLENAHRFADNAKTQAELRSIMDNAQRRVKAIKAKAGEIDEAAFQSLVDRRDAWKKAEQEKKVKARQERLAAKKKGKRQAAAPAPEDDNANGNSDNESSSSTSSSSPSKKESEAPANDEDEGEQEESNGMNREVWVAELRRTMKSLKTEAKAARQRDGPVRDWERQALARVMRVHADKLVRM